MSNPQITVKPQRTIVVQVSGTQGPSGEIALAAHIAAIDPHPQYVDSAETAALISNAVALLNLGSAATSSAASLRDRATHTGVQEIVTVTGLQAAIDGKASGVQGAKADTALQPAAIGATVQAADVDLSAIATLATVGLIERTGNGTAATTTVTAYIKSLLQAVDAASAKTILEVGATGGRMPYSSTNRSGATSVTPNAWTQIITLTALSDHLFIGNPIGSTSILDIGFGSAGAETLRWRISPGRSARVESRDRISIRCAIASQSYLASEAVYI